MIYTCKHLYDRCIGKISIITIQLSYRCFAAVVYSTPSKVSGVLLLQRTRPTQLDGDSLLQYEFTLTPLGTGSAVQLRYTLPATQSEFTIQGSAGGRGVPNDD